jgi:ABC-type polar amino acid transport system ATPase subunit
VPPDPDAAQFDGHAIDKSDRAVFHPASVAALTAEALQRGLETYQGTVLAVTHDRWFARSFERFLLFMPDGSVRETTEPIWD